MSHTLLSYALLLLGIHIINSEQLSSTQSGAIGAIYTMTTGVMNQVIVNRLTEDGELKVVRYVNTQGIGINITDIDPLFSQGRVVVYSNYLFVINPGSNSLSMFLINPHDPTELTLLSVQPVFGSFPVSVTVNSMYACVLTGGHTTGIRCFTYNSRGLCVVPSFDRDLTSYVSQTEPPTGPFNTSSEITFTSDNRALIVSVKGNPTQPGSLLFFLLSDDNTRLATNPVQQTPTNAVLPFSITLVGRNGLLVTDPGRNQVLTMTYSSTTGQIDNSQSAILNASLVKLPCWSTYSSRTGNYYIVGLQPAAVVELQLDVRSTSNPIKIVRYYLLPYDDIGMDAVVVSLPDSDYLYVIVARHDIIMGYKLCGPGNAIPIGRFVQQGEGTTEIDQPENPKCYKNTTSYADPSPPKTGPLMPPPNFHSNRTRPVLSGLDVYLQRASHGY